VPASKITHITFVLWRDVMDLGADVRPILSRDVTGVALKLSEDIA